ncbi:MAG: 1-acyl-sn-glycerol-3-phosphate acyltransferase [Pseudomonadales bacterium]|nr:1-acyl-sn-glycerol-3-phosphate acyltransferase [Pseudomonadales bacterium]
MSEFEEIRPYHDDEVESVITALLADNDLLDFVGKYHSPRLSTVFPKIIRLGAKIALKRALGKVKTIDEFQGMISFYAKKIVAETSSGFNFGGLDELEANGSYLFVGNHRDIAGDSMFVDYALWLRGRETVRIAVGDNLIQRDFATHLMKLNKSFFVRRSEQGAKKIYAAILESSRYIHQSLSDGQSVWIAQSEGRAKNGMDITDPAIIKMFALAKRKQALSETVKALNIVPVSISYEFDPCDYLKAKELYTIEQEGAYDKPAGEDLLSLVKGLGEFKGRIKLKFGERLAGDFDSAEEVANAIDRQILDNYQLYYINYWALEKLALMNKKGCQYFDVWEKLKGDMTFSDSQIFEDRYQNCTASWRRKWLEMYANPILNKYHSKSTKLKPI